MKRRVWIVGPVAMDRVAYINQLPISGSFTRPTRIVERIGGSSGNVALALAETGVETGFIGYIGGDAEGMKIEKRFSESKIKNLHLQKIDGESNCALVLVERTGERTIISLTENHLDEISLEGVSIESSDIVVFSLWRPFFIGHLKKVQSLGCITVVGLDALTDSQVARADFAVGSETELNGANPVDHLNRFPTIVVTRGPSGIDQYRESEIIHQEALEVKVVDTTGAGDSFLAGYLSNLAVDPVDLRSALRFGAEWAAATVAIEGSEPASPPL
jgi:sugar/nucleoside kinase (ribokinase family)